MNGMTRESGSRPEPASCKIVADRNGVIAAWVCRGLGVGVQEIGENFTLGFLYGGRAVGGLIYHGLQDGSLWWTIYTVDKHWCSRKVLKTVFGLAFDGMNCHRINIIVSRDNVKSLKLVKGLGFKTEGLLRRYRSSGEDCYLLGMLKNECKWREK